MLRVSDLRTVRSRYPATGRWLLPGRCRDGLLVEMAWLQRRNLRGWSLAGRIIFIIGMYGPPQICKRKPRCDSWVRANVFGFLGGILEFLAMMDSARSFPY